MSSFYKDGEVFLQKFVNSEFDFRLEFGDSIITDLPDFLVNEVWSTAESMVRRWAEKKLAKGEFKGVSEEKVFKILIARFRSYLWESANFRSKSYIKSDEFASNPQREWVGLFEFGGEVNISNAYTTDDDLEVDLELNYMPKSALISALKAKLSEFDKEEVEYLINKFKLNISIDELYKDVGFNTKVDGNGQMFWDFEEKDEGISAAKLSIPSGSSKGTEPAQLKTASAF